MPKRLSPLYPLTGEQRAASDPDALAWLSASAGTGKTQVLTARVMRLLLSGVDPASILCLTFTKAGAAEMADRIHARLAHWVRLKSPLLAAELRALGEAHDPDSVEYARQLFARVLDATGGGLRIQTIHAFAQSLLAAFPAEARIVPGFRPIEGREQSLLMRETLAAMLVAAEERADGALIADVQQLSRRLGEEGAEGFLQRCAHSLEAMVGLGATELFGDVLRRALDVPLGDIDAAIVEACSDEAFDIAALRRIAAANRDWGTKTGLANADMLAGWLAADAETRALQLPELRGIWATKQGDLRKFSAKLLDSDPEYAQLCTELDAAVAGLLALRIKAEFADFAAAALRAGRMFAEDYAIGKRRAGVLDFDDMIRLTRFLLGQEGIGEWVRYKLDRSIDHILVDEAQDTNVAQWSIIEGLSAEFFETDPDSADAAHRTIFAVGDFKQAIFGFQGTNPQAFEDAKQAFAAHIAERERELRDLSLDKSYRSSPPILELVDAVMDGIGGAAIGLPGGLRSHVSAHGGRPGRVTLLKPVRGEAVDDADPGEEGWLADAKLALARKMAKQVKDWLAEGPDQLWLASKGRALRPEDVLILVRSRGELASLLVARLHEEGVPVAGVDRLMLTDPLAIQDLLAALRFALQPEDDLNFANLLVSPLIGWSQDQLYRLARNRKSSLWSALRDEIDNENQEFAGLGDTRLAVNEILDQADFVTPYQLLESILSGPIHGRKKLLARLGEEARDPIEELLNAALLFEADNPPSLQHFLDWFDRGDAEIKRDPAAPLDAVRVMTVHGAKGLQAPLVILADATFDPDLARSRTVDFSVADDRPAIPLPHPRRAEQVDALADAVERQKTADREEHWRLLYVALTRAEEQLVIGGSLGPRNKDGAPQDSWYAAVERAMDRFDGDWQESDLWQGVSLFDGAAVSKASPRTAASRRSVVADLAKPEWLEQPAPQEERPPRPLAPSSLGADTVADPPPDAAMLEAAERGLLLHALFERLPEVEPSRRRAAALAWLERSAGLGDASRRERLADDALAVIDDPAFADIFGPDALAEAPIAAVAGDIVVSGTVDRLLVGEDAVRVVDFKTGRVVPDSIDTVPEGHLRQMAAYAAALEVVFPGRRIEPCLLYTSGPRLITLSDQDVAANKPGLPRAEQSLSPSG
ncbi:double-strand break repair helicase AddA [Parasphingopyxis algicola]|uniref:double-strand break repair helicase AddA n=1 Tax=Parasphingopyxis algicola TaxID=2026624 RepID=UPI0015A2F65B|nr:double-strand break repair helicase AddA [Parasphingopyxis algicola]QLC24253.1 double-strand break repair helicase AddA [Parasphingopyxis algicola]